MLVKNIISGLGKITQSPLPERSMASGLKGPEKAADRKCLHLQVVMRKACGHFKTQRKRITTFALTFSAALIFMQVFFSISRTLFLTPEEMASDSTMLVELYMGAGTGNPASPSTI